MSFLRSRGLRVTLASLVLSASVGTGTCLVGLQRWTRGASLEPFDPTHQSIIQHPSFQPLNLAQKPTYGDSFVREIAFQDIKPELLQEALSGRAGLIERFAGGVFGRYAYRAQRNLMKTFRQSDANQTDLWEEEQICQSGFDIGNIIADDFIVSDKSATAILLQGGQSPRKSLDEPHDMDTIVNLRVDLDTQRQVAQFRFQCIVATCETTEDDRPALGTVEIFLHECYAKLLLTAGVDYCLS